MDNREYLYVMDYSDSTICKIILDEEDKNLNTEQLLDRYNLNIDTCCCMFSEKNINDLIVLTKD